MIDSLLGSGAFAMYGPDLESTVRRLTDPAALESSRPFAAHNGERLGISDGVGILYVVGPLSKRNSFFARMMGFATYEVVRRDLQAALDNPDVDSIALYIDSPGGDANGCDELGGAGKDDGAER